ncbi:MAG: FmdB family zinc ribbon protein [bacterium]
MIDSHPFYVLHYECAKCQTLYDVTWDSMCEEEPPSQCPECGSPVRRFAGSSYRARPGERQIPAKPSRTRPERRTA